jgi:formylglycine-generating enzyme required for sulfatase activity
VRLRRSESLAAALSVAALAALAVFAVTATAAPGRPPRRRAPSPVVDGASVAVLSAPAPERVLLRGGTFQMGSTDADVADALALCRREPAAEDYCTEELFAAELPAHEVTVVDVWVATREVTVERYRRCVAAGRCVEPPFGAGASRFDRPELPVTMVSWHDAAAYCAFDGGRLPTEAEWERAARGLVGRTYPWGKVYNPFFANHGKLDLDELDDADGFVELAPVGSYVEGRTPEGVADLAGNVEEWVADWYAPEYPAASAHDPRGPDTGEDRVLRGGSYFHARPWMRAAARLHDAPSSRRAWRGFRCAYDR